jgi:hypothetical protein
MLRLGQLFMRRVFVFLIITRRIFTPFFLLCSVTFCCAVQAGLRHAAVHGSLAAGAHALALLLQNRGTVYGVVSLASCIMHHAPFIVRQCTVQCSVIPGRSAAFYAYEEYFLAGTVCLSHQILHLAFHSRMRY